MPRPDPVPSRHESMMRRFRRIMRLLALLSIAIAAVAVLVVARGQDPVRVHSLVATALGVGLTVLLGTALMTLTFLSASSGHDDRASRHEESDE